MSRELLLEIGAEEIPAGFVPKALTALEDMARKELEAARLTFDRISTMGTPRRLVLHITGLPELQPDAELTTLGPSKKAAFDADGKPTRAAEGFARSQGVSVSDLQSVETDKGEYLAVTKKETGRSTLTILSELLPAMIGAIPFRKSMRWGDHDIRFARPIHWIVALLDAEIIPFCFGPIKSGNISRGHRFMANRCFDVQSFTQYLSEAGRHFVIVDQNRRRELILDQATKLAREAGGRLLEDAGLLDEITYLVEYPTAIIGSIPAEFLVVPKEVLITSMRSHQRYFSVVDQDGKLLPRFITISNTRAEDMDVVVKGNERVLKARLSDARFFFDEDRKVTLESRVESLKSVVYQQKLGTSYQKMERFRTLAGQLADSVNPAVKEQTVRAAFLCKADLVTGMVGEFPEVQGIMGGEYALHDGESPEVATAIAEHYYPTQAGGAVPGSDIGAFVSLADKLDTVAGCFSVGLIPTGAADPYALRRATIGIISIIQQKGYTLSLSSLLDSSLALLAERLTRPVETVKGELLEFFRGRFTNLLSSRYRADLVEACMAAGFDDLGDCTARVVALDSFYRESDFQPLATTFKRVCNIVKEGVTEQVNPALFQDETEHTLHQILKESSARVAQKTKAKQYRDAFLEIASLKWGVDAFFDAVMVMADDQAVRTNRLALLTGINRLFADLADFSKISG